MNQLSRIAPFVPLALSAAVLGGLYWLWQQPLSHYDLPPFWLAALAGLTLLAVRLPWYVWLWWLVGLATLAWSQTPGNTLAAGIWELAYLAAFAAGTWWRGLAGLGAVLLGYNLFTTLSLGAFGLALYFSGSAHYVAGAQALTLLPVLFRSALERSRWQLTLGLGLVATVYLALLSGARAVYLPLLVVGVLLAWRLWQERTPLPRLVAGFVGVAAAVVLLDTALPFHPVQAALLPKTAVAKQVSDTSSEGSFGSRLQMWGQTIDIALQAPLGTGNGSFRDVMAAYQQYPSVNFANAHNHYLETAATGGWPRLIVLLGVLGWVLWRGWRGPAWPWALGAAGLWATLAFDITGMYPAVMMLAFAALGAVYAQSRPAQISLSSLSSSAWASRAAAGVGLVAAVVLVLWWYWPCSGVCSASRYLGFRPTVLKEATQLPPAQRLELLEQAAHLNPNSLWVYRAQLQYAQTPNEQLEVLRQLNQKFPLGSPLYYLQQAKLERQLGHNAQAIAVLERGLSRFPADFRPAGVPLGDSVYQGYIRWGQEAPQLLQELQR
ncbi:MAG: O-antigen ligase family protein [Meiothermus sp.]|nr:O-antigen ligase family protein [Meiothermus sp.]